MIRIESWGVNCPCSYSKTRAKHGNSQFEHSARREAAIGSTTAASLQSAFSPLQGDLYKEKGSEDATVSNLIVFKASSAWPG